MLKPAGEAHASGVEHGTSHGIPSWTQGADVQSNLLAQGSQGSRQRTDLALGKFFHRQTGRADQGRSAPPMEPQPWGPARRVGSPCPESTGRLRDLQILWAPCPSWRNMHRDEPGWGLARPLVSEHPTRQRKAAQWEPRPGGVIFFFRNRIPCGAQKSVGRRVWDVPVGLGWGQEGGPLAWPHRPKPTQEMPSRPQRPGT